VPCGTRKSVQSGNSLKNFQKDVFSFVEHETQTGKMNSCASLGNINIKIRIKLSYLLPQHTVWLNKFSGTSAHIVDQNPADTKLNALLDPDPYPYYLSSIRNNFRKNQYFIILNGSMAKKMSR
jgi:hypothetical protein